MGLTLGSTWSYQILASEGYNGATDSITQTVGTGTGSTSGTGTTSASSGGSTGTGTGTVAKYVYLLIDFFGQSTKTDWT